MTYDADQKTLRAALLTEVQAIAIYRAECAVLGLTAWTRRRRLMERICQRTLREELGHQSRVGVFVQSSPFFRALWQLNVAGGWALGLLLACLPSRWNWRIHAWAENEAARAYLHALAKLSPRVSRQVRLALGEAARQEEIHQWRFERMLDRR